MYIKSIHLKNFQKHEDRYVEFVDGVNIITGGSDIGKSAVRRAIEYTLFNQPCDGLRKEGTKQTSVTIVLSNGVEIERIRSASINRYILKKEDKEQIFDSVGRVIPEEIKDSIGIFPIEIDGEEIYLNSAKQIAMPFLFDRSGSSRMKIFNKLTGTDLLDKLFSQFNKDLLRISREEKTNTERLEILLKQSEEKEIEKEQLETVHAKAKKVIEELKEKKNVYDNYLNLLKLQQTNETSLKDILSKKRDLKLPKEIEIKELTIKIESLAKMQQILQNCNKNNTLFVTTKEKLNKIKIPKIDIKNLFELIKNIEELHKIQMNSEVFNIRFKKTSEGLKNTKNTLKELKDKLQLLIKETKICPTCNREFSEECIKEFINE